MSLNSVLEELKDLALECQTFDSDLDRLCSTTTTLQEASKAIRERVAGIQDVVERACRDPAELPLELLALVAQFLAGSNAFKSLANFSIASRRLHEELEPILYEVVTFDRHGLGLRGLSVLELCFETDLPTRFARTRFLLAPYSYSSYIIELGDIFPRLALVLGPSFRHQVAEHVGTFQLLKTIQASTLIDVLGIPLVWRTGTDAPAVVAANISDVKIPSEAYVLGSVVNQAASRRFVAVSSNDMMTRVDFRQQYPCRKFDQTLLNTLSVVLPSFGTPLQRPEERIPTLMLSVAGGVPTLLGIVELLEDAFLNSCYPSVSLRLAGEGFEVWPFAEAVKTGMDACARLCLWALKDGRPFPFTSVSPFYRCVFEADNGEMVGYQLRRNNQQSSDLAFDTVGRDVGREEVIVDTIPIPIRVHRESRAIVPFAPQGTFMAIDEVDQIE